jgi:hypothetical protein
MNNDGHHGAPRPDDGFERLLRGALNAEDSAAGSECLDIETLAAWCDGALAPSERSFAEAHVARCARCQSLLAVMARTAPEAAAPRTWSLRQWLMMLAPAAAATAAVALWFAVEPRRTEMDAPAVQMAARAPEAEHQSAPKTEALTANAAVNRPDKEVAPVDASPAVADERRQVAAGKDAATVVPGARARQEAVDTLAAVNEEKKREFAKAAGERSADAPPPSPPPPPAARPAEVPAPAPASPTTTAQAPLVQVQQAPARADQQQSDQSFRASAPVGGVAAGRGGGGALTRTAMNDMAAVRLVVASPDAAVQWRIVSERIVQQSTDKGTTWATQYTVEGQASIVAASAPAVNVAWLVGRSGLVLMTSDGRTWRRLVFPAAVDLTAVAAIDARSAIVTAADRRVFTTADGGQTWTIKP